MERPDSVVSFEPSRELYPFESRWFDSSIGPVHYVDEGIGPPQPRCRSSSGGATSS
jgi:haloalkane dehalogenase